MTRRLWRLQIRDLLTTVALLLVVAGFVIFAALTWRPQAQVWDRAEALPAVGELIGWIRGPYRLERAGVAGRRSTAAESFAEPATDVPEVEYVGVGAVFREGPSGDAATLETTRVLRDYRVVQRQGAWAQLVLGTVDGDDRLGWVDLAAERDMSDPPLGNDPVPPKPQPASPATKRQIALVMDHLEQPIDQSNAAGYTVLMGFRDLPLRAAVTTELRNLESRYRRRFRLSPIGKAVETVVIFDTEQRYRDFENTAPALAGLGSAGHSTRGLIALFRGDRSQTDVVETLRHEVVHLLNRRAIGPALPPWLEEGLADELAVLAELQEEDPFAAHRFRLGKQTLYRGPLASLRLLLQAEASGQWVSLQRMLGMDWEQFVKGGRSSLLYAESSFFVHWLLETDENAFHRYLNSISVGRPASAAELSRSFGRTVSQLDEEYRSWIRDWRAAAR